MRHSATSKLPFVLMLVIVVVLGAATFVEEYYGTDYAHLHIYGSWWFTLLWGVLAAAGLWLICKRRMWKRPALFVLHISFVVILAGALTTRLTSHRGMVHLREGESSRTCWVKNEEGRYLDTRKLPFYLALRDFQVTYDADGETPSDYVSRVVIATAEHEEEATISMNNIGRVCGYRIYQTSFDDDQRGSTFTVSYDPWGTAITYFGYIMLAISMVWVTLRRVTGTGSVDPEKGSVEPVTATPATRWPSFLLGICGVAMASYMVIAICQSPLVPVLRSPFLVVHVGTIMLSYVLLVLSIARRQVLRPAVFLLMLGIFLGAVWANVSWGTYWSWDPKESWALITLFIYSLPLHSQSLPWLQPARNYRLYSLLALATLLMTYFGVNLLLGGMHSYA